MNEKEKEIKDTLERNGIYNFSEIKYRPELKRLEIKLKLQNPTLDNKFVEDIIEVCKTMNLEFIDLSNNFIRIKEYGNWDEEYYRDEYDYTLLSFKDVSDQPEADKDLISGWFQDIVDLVDKCINNNYDKLHYLMEVRAHAKASKEYIDNFGLK